MLYSFLDVVLGILFRIFLRLEVHGAENIPKTGPLVIASNHLSLLDQGIFTKLWARSPLSAAARTGQPLNTESRFCKAARCWRYSRKGRAAKQGSLASLNRAL